MDNDGGGRSDRLNNIDSDGAAVVRLNDEDFDSDSRGGFLKNFGAVIVALGAAVAASAAASAQDGFGHIIEPSLKAVVTVTVIPATDTISRGDSDQDTLQKWLENFFGEQNRNSSSTAIGSGFLVSEDGLIVTNAHVVSAGSEVTVSLHDDSEHPARLVGKDAASDLALLKIEHPGALPFLRWGDDSRSRVGDWAIALGNPFALGTSAALGLISARDRSVPGSPQHRYIQTDASINRGNSGGPLLNGAGEVIGVNTAVLAPGGASVGVGFAVPAAQAKRVVAQLLENGEVRRPWLGVFVETPRDSADGALVSAIAPGSPAGGGRLEIGDLLISVNGARLREAADLAFEVQKRAPGDEITLRYLRGDTQDGVSIRLAERGAAQTNNVSVDAGRRGRELAERLGLVVEPLDDAGGGVSVVRTSGEAERAGIRGGDVIVELDAGPARSPEVLYQQLEEMHARQFQFFAVKARRGNAAADWVLLRLPPLTSP